MRTCSRCGEEKELTEANFRFSRARGGRWMYYCRPCERAYKNGWQRANPEKLARYAAQDRLRHLERFQGYDQKRHVQRASSEALRRAAKRSTETEYIDRSVIYKRDGGICQICLDPVSEEEFHMDHRVPLARGGSHTYDNVQVAHGSCNCKKGMKMQEGAVS